MDAHREPSVWVWDETPSHGAWKGHTEHPDTTDADQLFLIEIIITVGFFIGASTIKIEEDN